MVEAGVLGRQLVDDLNRQQAADEEGIRVKRVARAWQYYWGNAPLALKATKSDPQNKDSVRINLIRFAVNTSAFFLFGKPVKFEVDGQKKSTAGDWLDKCWQQNQKEVLLLDAAINGGVTGDVFLRLKPAALGQKYPRMILMDSANVTAVCEPDDISTVIEFRNQWKGIDPVGGKPVVYRQVFSADGDGWHITFERSSSGAGWSTVEEPVRWNYPFAPIQHAKNLPNPNAYYGTPDAEDDVMDTNQGVSFQFSNISRILRTHAHPKTWGKGFNIEEMNTSVDAITVFDSDEAELHNLEMLGDLTSSIEFARAVKEVYHQVTSIPEIAAGKVDNIGQLSGLAMQILYGPAVRLTDTKQTTYGAFLSGVNQCLLAMGNQGADHEVTNQWQSVLPKDDLSEAQAAIAKQEAGVSRDTSLTEMGYDAPAEDKKKADEDKAAMDQAAQAAALTGQQPGQQPDGKTANDKPAAGGKTDGK